MQYKLMYILLSTYTWIRLGIFIAVMVGAIIFRLYARSKAKGFNDHRDTQAQWRRLPFNSDTKPYQGWNKIEKRSMRIINEGLYLGGSFIPFDKIAHSVLYRPKSNSFINELISTLRIHTDHGMIDIFAPYRVLKGLESYIPIDEEIYEVMKRKYFYIIFIGIILAALLFSFLRK